MSDNSAIQKHYTYSDDAYMSYVLDLHILDLALRINVTRAKEGHTGFGADPVRVGVAVGLMDSCASATPL